MKSRKRFKYKNISKLADEIDWKGTPGMGDAMFGLNVAHNTARRLNKSVQIKYHWYYDARKQYHCEDPETLIERIEYVNNFYHNQKDVSVVHTFDSNDGNVYTNRYIGTDESRHNAEVNTWKFRDSANLKTDENKVVFWRPTFNAEMPRNWKLLLSHEDWDKAISNLEMHGYNPVELTYRTPIHEAMFHINTCKFVVCYDGMWHYIAKNFWKPMLVLSTHNVTTIHTPHCLSFNGGGLLHYTRNFNISKRRQLVFSNHWVDKNLWRKNRGNNKEGSFDIFENVTAMEQIEKRARWYKIEMAMRTWENNEYTESR